jgi:hypothetical protein
VDFSLKTQGPRFSEGRAPETTNGLALGLKPGDEKPQRQLGHPRPAAVRAFVISFGSASITPTGSARLSRCGLGTTAIMPNQAPKSTRHVSGGLEAPIPGNGPLSVENADPPCTRDVRAMYELCTSLVQAVYTPWDGCVQLYGDSRGWPVVLIFETSIPEMRFGCASLAQADLRLGTPATSGKHYCWYSYFRADRYTCCTLAWPGFAFPNALATPS